jgi:hypothetical protein
MLISPGFGVQRAFQTDVGIELSLGDAFPIGSTLMLTSTVAGPRFLRPWNERCGAEVTDQNSLEYVRDRMAEMPSMGMGGLADALSQQIVDGTLPLLDSLSSSGAGGLDDNVPAASNGDYYAELLSSPGTDFPANPPNTSADALTVRSNDRLVAAGDDTGAILAAGVQTLREVEQSIPSLLSQATLQREAVTAARSADELGRLINPSAQDRKRFIAEDIKHLSIPSGEQAEVTLTAEELAELLGRPVADVNGATVVVNAGAAIEDASFLLEGRGLRLLVDVGGEGLLVRFDVDLSTADGTFPGDVEDWIVRPAMYQIDVEAGPAAGVILTGPRRLVSGGPASLSVQVIDDNGRRIKKPYSVRFVNAAGQEVGATNSEGGTALLQYVPDPTAPFISEVAPTVVSSGGDEGPGLEIDGVGFSRDAEVLVDGTPLVEATDFQVRAPERILVRFPATLTIGTHAVHVVNPEGLTSNDVEFSIAVEN